MMTTPLVQHADFRRLWFGQSLSAFGDRISRIALPTLALLSLHAAAWQVGVLAALGTLPYLLLGPFAGVLADRVPRRSLLILTDSARLVSLLTLPLAAQVGHVTLPHLMIVAAVNGVLTVFFDVSYQAYLPCLVGREHLMEANSKLSLTRSVADVSGSAVAGVLLQAFGAVFGVLLDALTFLVSALSVARIRDREEPRVRTDADARGILMELRAGADIIGHDRRLWTLMTATGVVNLGGAAASAVILVYAYRVVGLTPFEVGIAFGAGGAGLVAGSLVASRIAAWLGLSRSLILTVVTCGLSSVALSVAPASVGFVVLVVAQFVAGFGSATYNIQVLSTVGSIVPFELLGRVGGTAMSVVHGSGSLGAAVGGVIASAIGVRTTIGVSGLVVCAVALPIALSPLRYLGRDRDAHATDPAVDPARDQSDEQEAASATRGDLAP